MIQLDYIICYLIIFIFGSAIGSFLNVVIYRIPSGESIVAGRSHCMSCHSVIKGYDLIPIVSYLLLRKRCRACGAPISCRYPIVEAVTGILCVVTFAIEGLSLLSLFYFIYGALLLTIAMIDWDTMTIPDRLNICILVVAVPILLLQGEFQLWSIVGGFFVISVPMLLLAMVIPGAFGGGDIKLMAVSGLILGLANTLLAFFIGVLIGGGYGIYLLGTKKAKKKEHMAFGPYLCIGCYVALLYGDSIIRWYFGFF